MSQSLKLKFENGWTVAVYEDDVFGARLGVNTINNKGKVVNEFSWETYSADGLVLLLGEVRKQEPVL